MTNEEKKVFEQERREKFEEVVKPLEDFINKYGCPHDTIIINQLGAEFVCGEIGVAFKLRD